jgi:ABC-type multidrug transport system fused ATPase/permease subunit
MTIAENISLRPAAAIDGPRLTRTLELADLAERLQSLPAKENTLLIKQVHQEAIELSGGEKQKLALARALYKAGVIIVLDEPTAALDPIAESRQYERYARLTEGCTSLYISHRLSSTHFCDKILFLEDGAIAETGSHEALMALGGKYASLYVVQSQYYREEETA